jgi:capsular polysaccharide biosynthesis protein
MAMNKQRDELSVYRRDMEAAQRAYDDVSKSASQTRLQSLSNQTNVTRLDAAAAPTRPSGPGRTLILLGAAFAGGLLGIGVALALELMHRRVRSVADMVQVLDLPVLARVGPAGAARSRVRPTLLPSASPLSIGHGSSS